MINLNGGVIELRSKSNGGDVKSCLLNVLEPRNTDTDDGHFTWYRSNVTGTIIYRGQTDRSDIVRPVMSPVHSASRERWGGGVG